MPSDDRIPNSLQTQSNECAFDPDKYAEEIHQAITPKSSQPFPALQKVLTYSNLKLHKEEDPSSKPVSNGPQTPIHGIEQPPAPISSKLEPPPSQPAQP